MVFAVNTGTRTNWEYDIGEVRLGIESPGPEWLCLNGSDVPIDTVLYRKLKLSDLFNVSWATQASQSGSTGHWSIAYGNGNWITGMSGGIRSSTDGVLWVSVNNYGNATPYSLQYGNNLWIAGAGNNQFPIISTSTDAVNWVTQTINVGTGTSAVRGISYGNGLYVIVLENGRISTSTDAVTWVSRNPLGTSGFYAVAYGNGIWAAAGRQGLLRTSTDGVTWVSRNPAFSTSDIVGVAYANGLWIAGGSGGALRSSTDAITWVTRTPNVSGSSTILSVAYGDGLWLVGTSGGGLRASTDGISWATASPQMGTTGVWAIAYSQDQRVFVAGGGGSSTGRNLSRGARSLPAVWIGNNVWGWVRAK